MQPKQRAQGGMRSLHQLVRVLQLGLSPGPQILQFPSLTFSFFCMVGRQEIYIKWVPRPPATLTLKLELSLVLQSALYPIVCMQVCFVSKRIHKEKGTVPIPPPLKQYRGQYISQQETLEKEGLVSCEKSLKSCSSCGFLVAPF